MSPMCPDLRRACSETAPMMSVRMVEPSGHVFRVDRRRGPVWYAKYRLPDGRQVQKKIGPAYTEGTL